MLFPKSEARLSEKEILDCGANDTYPPIAYIAPVKSKK
jgi:hypothetical protein